MIFRVLALIIFMMGCVHLSHVKPQPRTLRAQELTTVELNIWCNGVKKPMKNASGVIIDARHVLTAYHAVECANIPVVKVFFGSRPYRLVVVKEDRHSDLALLELLAAENFKINVPPPAIAPAISGEAACSSVAHPRAGWSCGEITRRFGMQKGDLAFVAETVGGNSGSAVYNQWGELIGIVVEKVACATGGTDGCTGTVTSLYGKTEFYPK